MMIYSLFKENERREKFRLLPVFINNMLENYIIELEEPLVDAANMF